MPFRKYSEHDNLQSRVSTDMPKHKEKNLVAMCNIQLSFMQASLRILRNTTVHDAFYLALFDGLFPSKSP